MPKEGEYKQKWLTETQTTWSKLSQVLSPNLPLSVQFSQNEFENPNKEPVYDKYMHSLWIMYFYNNVQIIREQKINT